MLPGHDQLKRSSRFHGFGYDSATGDYKLILGATSSKDQEIKFAVFTLKKGSWRTLENLKYFHLKGQGCFANGALHWLDSNSESTRIVSIDLAKVKCVELCQIVHGTMFKMGIGAIRNRLCYYRYSTIRSIPMTIWVMNEYGINRPWTKLMNIPTTIIPYKISLTPKEILESGEVLMISDGRVRNI